MRFVKMVYASINENECKFTSFFPDNIYSVEYIPGSWTYPVLEKSKLFAWDNIASAMAFFRGNYTVPRKMPYRGAMLWYCIVVKPIRRPILLNVPDYKMVYYWSLINQGLKDTALLYAHFNKIYRYRYEPKAVLCDALQIVAPLYPEDIEPYKKYNFAFLDR